MGLRVTRMSPNVAVGMCCRIFMLYVRQTEDGALEASCVVDVAASGKLEGEVSVIRFQEDQARRFLGMS